MFFTRARSANIDLPTLCLREVPLGMADEAALAREAAECSWVVFLHGETW